MAKNPSRPYNEHPLEIKTQAVQDCLDGTYTTFLSCARAYGTSYQNIKNWMSLHGPQGIDLKQFLVPKVPSRRAFMAKKSSITASDPEEFSSDRERAEYLETKVRYLEALLEITGYDPNDPVKKNDSQRSSGSKKRTKKHR
jgi:hypothetical protein